MKNTMSNKKKLIINMNTSIIYQVITIVCNLILPRFILSAYGSATNGLINSITQFLGFISMCELGMGAVVQSSLYKPLAEKNWKDISAIYHSSQKFFTKIAYILAGYVLLMVIVYPYIANSNFDTSYIVWMILIISISSFAQYFFGVNNSILLNADQRTYISVVSQCIVLIINIILCIVLIKLGFSAHFMKAASSLVFIVRPFVLYFYVKKNYLIDKNIKYDGEPIKQKWNGIAQHFAHVVIVNTPVVVLTLFSTLENVSVYSVYYLVAHGIRQMVMSLTNGMQAFLGNLYAKKDAELEKAFDVLETGIHYIVTLIFSVTGIMIVSFVKLYTKGINDINYIDNLLAITITLGYALYCLRLPYQMMVFSAGHYEQTQKTCFIEMGLNIISSVLLVFILGTAGVCIGLCIAMFYRMICFAMYLRKNIINRNLIHFVKKLVTDAISVVIIYIVTRFTVIEINNYFDWVIQAIIVTVIAILITTATYFIVIPTSMKNIFKKVVRKFK